MGAATYGKIAAGAALGPLRRRPEALPGRELRRDGIAVDRGRLAAYDRVCGFRLSDTLPPTYPHVLAFPLAIELIASREFPFGALGLVHVDNAIEQLRPLRADEPLDLLVWSEQLAGHPRGRTIDVVAEGSVGGEPVWRDRSTYLHRERAVSKKGSDPFRDTPEADAVWDAPGAVGRRYAAVSGDRNPIHLHPLAARAFGQKGTIAHGMWTKARCLAALEGSLPSAFAVDVRFKTPLPVPGKAAFGVRGDEFFVWEARSGRPVLSGRTSKAAG
jgi:hypothetical protein